MEFAELKKSLKEKIENNYLISGSDSFLLNRAVELIKNAICLNIPDLNLSIFNGESVDFDEVVKSLNTLPAMDSFRVVCVNLSIKCDVQHINALKEYFTCINPTSVFIVNVGENIKLVDDYKQYFVTVDCSKIDKKYVLDWVVYELHKQNKTITPKALDMLFDYTLGEMAKINNEITKLVSFTGENNTITEADIVEMVPKSVEFQIFELTEALAKKNARKVYTILDILKSKKDTYRSVISLIYNHFRRLFMIAVSKYNKSEISQMLGIKEYAVTKSLEQAKLFTKKQLKEINEICMQMDYETRQSATQVDTAIEYIVLKILNY